MAVLCSIGASSLAAAACDELFRPLLSRLPGGRKAANVKPPFDMAIEMTAKLGKVEFRSVLCFVAQSRKKK